MIQNIRPKILLTFTVLLLLTALIGVIAIANQRTAVSVATSLEEQRAFTALLSDDLAQQWQQTRNLERGFNVSYAESGQFLITLNRFFSPWESTLTDFRAQISTLEETSDQRITRMLAGLDDYETQVNTLVAQRRERTLLAQSLRNDSQLTDALTASEQSDLELIALQMRRHLNAYLLTGENRYVRDFNLAADSLQAALLSAGLDGEASYLAALQTTRDNVAALQAVDSAVIDTNSGLQSAVELVDRTLLAITDNARQEVERSQNALAALNQRTLLTVLPLLLLVIIVAGLLATTLSNNLTRQVETLQDTIGAVNRGDLSARAQVVNQDELGSIAGRLNAWLDALARRALTDQEELALQQGLMVLLEDVSAVAMGDLSAEANADDELTGNVAIAFNEMTDALQRIIAEVQQVTIQFSTAADEIEVNSATLAERSADQADQILNTSVAVDAISNSIQRVARNTLQSAEVADNARSDARMGAAAVRQTLLEMQHIEQDVTESQEYVRTLNNNAWQIDDIIDLIDEIADRTSVLALNATIRALAAGEDGRGFAVVAREVESLADQSARATRRVARLVAAVRDEAEAAQSAMTLATETVRVGREVANSAEGRLSDIENVTSQLATLLQQIRLATQQQAENATTVAQSMDRIANVTQQTAAGTRETSLSIRNLAQLADQLRESVTRFRADVPAIVAAD